jgi:hypothetical protein
LHPGRYRLAVYAWDWAGNTSALADGITLPPARAPSRPGRRNADRSARTRID